MKNGFYILLALLFLSQVNYAQNCSPITSSVNNGSVKIVIYSENGECFKARLLNQYLSPEMVNQITFYESVGLKKINIEMGSGETIKKSLPINPDFAAATFRIKKNKKGDYIVKLVPGETRIDGPTLEEEMAQTKKNLNEFQERSNKEHDEWLAKNNEKKAKEEEESKAFFGDIDKGEEEKSVGTSGGSTSDGHVYESGGEDKILLRIMYGRERAVGSKVSVGYKGVIIGSGITDNDGFVTIHTDGLFSRNIDVYGESDDGHWKIEGLIQLDENNYSEVDPTKVLEQAGKKVKEFMDLKKKAEDGTIDEYFGF